MVTNFTDESMFLRRWKFLIIKLKLKVGAKSCAGNELFFIKGCYCSGKLRQTELLSRGGALPALYLQLRRVERYSV